MGSLTWSVDISHWQGNINIGRIADEGFAACVTKATEGTTYVDSKLNRNIPLIQKTGMIPGAYHYLRAGDGAAQARHFYNRIKVHGGPVGWLIQLDCESDGYGPQMATWANEWAELTGGHPFLLYSGAWWWPRTHNFNAATLTPYLWHSHYVAGSDTAARLYAKVPTSWWSPGYGGFKTATMLQFSSKGKVAGQLVDVNAFRGSVDQLRALTRRGTGPKPPVPKPPTPPSSKTHKVKSGDTLTRISRKHYGTANRWDDIYELNRDVIESVARRHGFASSDRGNRIWPGTVLRLP